MPRTQQQQLRKRLTKLQYAVTREAGTERPFSGIYWNHHGDGIDRCVVCHEPLFDSSTQSVWRTVISSRA